jgi:SecD-like export protein
MSDYFDRVERQLVHRVQEGVPRSTRLPALSGHLATAAAVIVVIVVAGIFLLAHGRAGENPAPAADPGAELSFTPSTLDGQPAGQVAIAETVQLLRARLAAAVPDARVSFADGQIVVRAPHPTPHTKARIVALAAPGGLAFYDWEADVLTANGKTVASQLVSHDPTALEVSQGNGQAAPGDPGAGAASLGQALALASKLGAGTRHRVEHIGRLAFSIPVGYVVLQATGHRPGAQFYLLRNRPAMSNGAITGPRENTDANTSAPDVEFKFTASGRRAFETVTANIARRGSLVSGVGQTLNQHFAIAVDNTLISVPFIDYKQYPDGITGAQGADVTAGPTRQSAKTLAILLRYGPLPVSLTATG